MPELKRDFSGGKMNKDLDERLLPAGTYRDALNIQVAGSESSNVGAVQNILGNQLAYTANIGVVGGKCIGSIADTENEKIYWFIAGTAVDAIAEFDQSTETVLPVVVSVKATADVLQFDKEKYITGVNLVDGLLFWTDNKTEPKIVNIERFKEGSTNWTTHTPLKNQADGSYNFKEDDITVIKKGPSVAPTITMANTKRVTADGSPAITSSTVNYDFSSGGELRPAGYLFITLALPDQPTFQIGDILTLSAGTDETGFDDEYTIRLIVTSGYFGSSSFGCTILSISENTPLEAIQWDITLKQDDPMFEKEFVRFAYRYKYKDGEYSTFSPFTEVAFLPQIFEYEPAQGYNTGMVNDLRYLKLTDFIPSDIHEQVEEVDLLFKKENNTNIYVVKSFKYDDPEWSGTGTYEIESEIIYKTVETNQLIRPWDNVPLKAKAQELIANRIVYGNYTQQFDLTDSNNKEISPNFTVTIHNPQVYEEKTAAKSIKSMRTYQFGVVYRDAYGRETPVQSDDSGSYSLSKADAINVNQFKVSLNHPAPAFATSYKYFIKETDNEYYNLSMDRYYDAEDGNVWLTFPSSERNKVTDETFLILKKQHDNDTFVTDSAKYKIIAIQNEAPVELKETRTSYGSMVTDFETAGFPILDGTYFEFDFNDFETRFGENSVILSSSDLVIRIISSSGQSEWYDVASISLQTLGGGDGDDRYRISIAEKFKEDVIQFSTDGTPGNAVNGCGFEIAKVKTKNKKEFTGRFFVKVYKDYELQTNVLSSNQEDNYSIKSQKALYKNYSQCSKGEWEDVRDGNHFWLTSNCGIHSWKTVAFGTKPGLAAVKQTVQNMGIKTGSNKIAIFFLTQRTLPGVVSSQGGVHSDFATALTTNGTKFRFTSDPDKVIYTIKEHAYRGIRNGGYNSGWLRNKRIAFVLELDKPIGSFALHSDLADRAESNIEILQNFENENTYRSQNPAIWETEPKEAIELDLYYEASDAFPIADHSNVKTLDWFNCFSFGNGVESNRIRDDFNAMTITKGVKVSMPLAEQYKQENRKNGLIYSGLYNSTSGINKLNQFIQGESITKDLNPEYGSIQKLHQRDTDLTVCCEDKILKVLANKDALYESGGNPQLTSTNRVLGQSIPYIGEYGISKNPESFASYGFRAYFTDKARGVVLRLSRNGLTEISMHGMVDYFRDKLAITNVLIGSFDDSKDLYNITLKNEFQGEIKDQDNNDTVSYRETIQGWTSRKSFIPESAVSLNNIYYSFNSSELYSHNNEVRNTFYAATYRYNTSSTTNFEGSSVKLILNDQHMMVKSFKTINYEGSQSRIVADAVDTDTQLYNLTPKTGWYVNSLITDKQSGTISEFKEKEGKWFNYIKGDATTLLNLDSKEFNVQGIGIPSTVTVSAIPSVTITIKENAD